MRRTKNEQGMALLAVVAVLVALVLIATPFALQMQSAADRSQDLLYSEQADQEAQQLFTLVSLFMLNGVEEVERDAAGQLDEDADEEEIPLYATPDYDVPAEIQLPAAELANFNGNSARGRIWDVRMEDEQAKLNLNSAPYQVIGNLFGATTLTRELEEGDDEVRLADYSHLPKERGVIRVGTEMIFYEELDGTRLRGVQRGYMADKPWNSSSKTWKSGETVILGSAFEMATLPIRIDEKGLRPYRNVYEAKRIVELGTAAIKPDNFDRYQEFLTCWSGREVAGGWSNSQVIRNSLPSSSSGDEGDYLVLDDPTYFGAGTIVRVSSGEKVEYGVVLENNGRRVQLGSRFENDYQIGEARVEALARHPVNINTASDEVLTAALANIRLRLAPSQDVMTQEKARSLIKRIREEPVKSLKQFEEILQQAELDSIISQSDYYAIYLNALHPGHYELSYSTVPFCFKSWDTYTVKATAVVNSRAGEEIARKTLRRVISVSPRRSAVYSIESQSDFETQIIASRDAKYMMTFPRNTGGQYQGRVIPPSRFTAHIYRDIWPEESRKSGLGDVRLQPERLNLARVFHYDESHYADGYYISGSSLDYSTRNENIRLADTDGTMRPLAAEFWYRPYWGGVGGTQVLMDTGEQTWTNRVGVFFDGTRQQLVFRVADATLEDRAVEVRYDVDADQIVDETWYHVAMSAPGTKPGDLTLLLDGQSVGDPTYLTRLSQSVQATGEISELYVDDASSFPESGALLLRGEDGSEIMEYEGRTDGSFTITRRFAREPIALTQSDSYPGHAFADGAVVTLLGYSSPLLTDIPTGGSSLVSDLDAFHCMKVLFIEDKVYITEDSADGGGGGGDLGTGLGGGIGGEPPTGVIIQDPGAGIDPGTGGGGDDGSSIEILGIASDRETVTLELGDTLKAWDDGADDATAFAAFGETGFAMLVSPQVQLGEGQSADETIGGWEIVYYEKSGTNLTIRRYQETRQIEAADFHFVPAHTYGSEEATITVNMGGGDQATGVATALIPISIEGTGGGGVDYFDVTEDDELTVPALALNRVYCALGTEWFAYTYPDTETSSGKTLFVHDRPTDINSVAALFGAGTVTTSVAVGDDRGDLPGDLPPDVDPPPEPPAPPPPGEDPPPQDDDGGPSGGDSPAPGEPGDDGGPPPPEDDDGGPSGGDTPFPGDPDDPPPTDDDGGPSGDPSPFPGEPGDPGTDPPPDGDNDGGPGGGPGPFPGEPGDPGTEPPGGDPDDGPGSGNPPPDEPPGGDDGDGDDPPSEDPGADIGASNSIGETEVPWPEEEIARRLKHRARSEFTIADTFEAEPTSQGEEIRPAFMAAAYRGERPGYDDRFTIVLSGEGPQEELRIRHSFAEDALKTWISTTTFVSTRYEHSDGSINGIVRESVELKDVARILKFPSGELPDAVGDLIRFGSRFDGSGVSTAVLDELYFKNDVNDEVYRLGDGSALVEDDSNEFVTYEGSPFADLDANQTSVFIHMRPSSGNPDGLPVTGLEEDGGVLRLADEIIVYRELDTATGELKRVERGVLNTEPGTHAFDSPVTEMEGVTVAVLDGGVSASSFELPMNRRTGFPSSGYVRINDEVLGYTRVQGNSLVMPQEVTSDETGWGESAGDADVGAGIFRARYGSLASDHGDDSIVFLQPSRYPDRFRDRSVHPETSALILRKRMDGAIWKRISWDERLADHTDIKVFVRFDGTPEWDSDNVYNVSEGIVASGRAADFRADPKSFLFLIDNSHDLNRFRADGGIQADVVEVRITYQYEAGAFDPYMEPPANSWKDTPWLKALRLEYVAPVTVHYSEEVR